MKLYELKRGDVFTVKSHGMVPPDAPTVVEDMTYTFYNVDGMYSYCVGTDGRVYHIAAYAEVEVVK